AVVGLPVCLAPRGVHRHDEVIAPGVGSAVRLARRGPTRAAVGFGDRGALLPRLEQPGAARAQLLLELREPGDPEADAENEQRAADYEQDPELAGAPARERGETRYLVMERRRLRLPAGE